MTTHIGEDARADREDGSIPPGGEFHLLQLAAPMPGNGTVLPAFLDPLDRSAEAPSGLGHGNLLGHASAFTAKAAPDVLDDDANPLLVEPKVLGDRLAHAVGGLGRN